MKKKLLVLLLDNKSRWSALIQRELTSKKIAFTLNIVSGKRDFVQALKKSVPDVIFSSVQLLRSSFTGLQALEYTKKNAPTIPFLFFVESAEPGQIISLFNAGAADVLLGNNSPRIGEALTSALEKKSAAEELREAALQVEKVREQYKTILENITDAYVFFDAKMNFLSLNTKAQEYLSRFGKAEDELLGKNVWKEFPALKKSPLYKTFLHAQLHNIPLHCELFQESLKLWLELYVYPSPGGFSVYIRDITKWKIAENESKNWRGRYETIVGATGEVIYEWDVQSDVTVWGGSLESVLGYDPHNFVNTLSDWAKLIHPDDREYVITVFTKAFDHLPKVEAEYRLMHKDGTYRYVLDHTTLVRDEQGRLIKSLGSLSDITQRKQEEKLRSALYLIAEKTSSAEDIQEFYKVIHSIIGDLMYAKNFYIAMFDETTRMLDFPYFVDEFDPPPPPQQLGKGLTEYVLRKGKPLLCSVKKFEELVRKKQVEQIGAPSVDWLGVPLKTKNKTIGVLVVQSYKEQIRYGKKDEELLTFVSQHIASALEHVQREEAIKASEAYSRNLVQSSLDMIIAVDSNRTIVEFNKAAEEAFGFSRAEVLGKNVNMLYADPDEGMKVHKTTIEQGRCVQEILNKRKSGELFPSYLSASVLVNSKGVIVGLMGVSRDVSERKKTEAEHKALEQKFISLFEHVPDGVYQSSPGGRLLTANPALVAMLGYASVEELCKVDIAKDLYLHPADRNKFSKKLEITGELRNLELILLRKDGVQITVLENSRVVHNGNGSVSYYEGTITDITERKHAEQELEKSLSLLLATLESTADGILVVNENRNIASFNQKFVEMWKIPEEIIVTRNDEQALLFVSGQLKNPNEFLTKIKELYAKPNVSSFDVLEFTDGRVYERYSMPQYIGTTPVGRVWSFRDVTERVQTEQQIAMQTKYFRQLFENAPIGIIMIDEQDNILHANKSFETMFQFSLNEIRGLKTSDIIIPELLSDEAKQFHQLALQGQVIDTETVRKRKDGELVNVHMYGVPIKSGEKQGRMYRIYEDITEYKKAENSIHNTAEQRKRLLDVSESILSTLSLDELLNRILRSLKDVLQFDTAALYWFDAQEQLLRPAMYVGSKWITGKFYEWAIPLGRGIMSAVVLSGKGELVNNAHRDERSIYPEGVEIDCEHLISIPVRSNEKSIGVFNIVRNSNPQFTQEEFELVQLFTSHASLAIQNAKLFELTKISEEKYRDIFEESQDCIFVSTPTGTLVEMNRAGVELFGYSSRDEFSNLNLADVYVDPADRENIQRILEKQGFIRDYEFKIKRKDGQRRTVIETTTVVYDDGGKIQFYRGIIRDVTERKKLEDQLRQSQKMESIGILAGGIAHDFNNLLGIILGYASLLEKQKDDAEKRMRNVEAIHKAVQRGAALVRQLLTFARKTDVIVESVNANMVVEELKKMLTETFPKTISTQLMLEQPLPSIVADANQLHQALLNLCVNARDAMAHNGTLTLKTEMMKGQVVRERIAEARGEEYVCISVADTGAGMDENTRSHIFEPFFTTKERGKGTGLGLAVVYGIVKSLHGYIDVESEIGKGTTFRLYFAVQPRTIEYSPYGTSKEEESVGGNETILIVEDEEMLLNILKATLEEKGYTVLTAMDGAEGVETYRLNSKEISLVISDMGLPKLSGEEEFFQIKKINPLANIILASGFFAPDIKEELSKAGAKGFIQKPYEHNEILKKIREVITSSNQ